MDPSDYCILVAEDNAILRYKRGGWLSAYRPIGYVDRNVGPDGLGFTTSGKSGANDRKAGEHAGDSRHD